VRSSRRLSGGLGLASPSVIFGTEGVGNPDLRRLVVLCCRHQPFVKMVYIGFDTRRGWAIYACPVCGWRAGFDREGDKIILRFGS
jgi:hypothetical protein